MEDLTGMSLYDYYSWDNLSKLPYVNTMIGNCLALNIDMQSMSIEALDELKEKGFLSFNVLFYIKSESTSISSVHITNQCCLNKALVDSVDNWSVDSIVGEVTEDALSKILKYAKVHLNTDIKCNESTKFNCLEFEVSFLETYRVLIEKLTKIHGLRVGTVQLYIGHIESNVDDKFIQKYEELLQMLSSICDTLHVHMENLVSLWDIKDQSYIKMVESCVKVLKDKDIETIFHMYYYTDTKHLYQLLDCFDSVVLEGELKEDEE